MTIPQHILDEIQERTDIVSLISSYLPLKKSGRNFKTLCPFHSEKTPSFLVSPSKQIFHCFGCGVGGGPIQFVMQYEKIGFREAVEMLAKRLGITLPKRESPQDSLKIQGYSVNKEASLYFHKNIFLPESKRALDYLKNRGLKPETVNKFQIGYALRGFKNLLEYMRKKNISISILDKLGLISPTKDGSFIDLFRGKIIFPIFDVKSRVIGFGGRRLEEDKNAPKYINTPESLLYHKGKTLFGINLSREAILKKDFCIIVEGYLDMIIPYQEGIDNILASLGTALTLEQIRMIKRYTKNVVLIFDPDTAGKISSLRAIDLMIEENLNVKAVSLPSGFDPDSFVRKKGSQDFLKLIQEAEDFFFYKLNILIEKFNLSQIQEKSELLLEMLSTLSKFNNQLTKYEYLKKLAERLDTKEEFLLVELKKMETRKRESISIEEQRFDKKGLELAEEYLIKSIFLDKKILKIVREAVDPDEFSTPILRAILEECFKYWDEFLDFDLKNILSRVNNEVANKISQLSLEDFSFEQDILMESIIKVKKNFQKTKKKFLKEKIKRAEQEKDSNILSLISEYERMIKEEKL